MKRIFLTLALLASTLIAFSQPIDSVDITSDAASDAASFFTDQVILEESQQNDVVVSVDEDMTNTSSVSVYTISGEVVTANSTTFTLADIEKTGIYVIKSGSDCNIIYIKK